MHTCWKYKSLLGTLSNITNLLALKLNISKVGLEKEIGVRYVGGLRVLLTFVGGSDKAEEFLASEKALWSSWFLNLRMWVGDSLHYDRIAWVNIRGFPPHLWDDMVFNKIDEGIGSVIQVSEASSMDSNMDCHKIAILVESGKSIDECMELCWNDQIINVWVQEEHKFWAPGFLNPMGISMDSNPFGSTGHQQKQARCSIGSPAISILTPVNQEHSPVNMEKEGEKSTTIPRPLRKQEVDGDNDSASAQKQGDANTCAGGNRDLCMSTEQQMTVEDHNGGSTNGPLKENMVDIRMGEENKAWNEDLLSSDPFGLNDLIEKLGAKNSKSKRKKKEDTRSKGSDANVCNGKKASTRVPDLNVSVHDLASLRLSRSMFRTNKKLRRKRRNRLDSGSTLESLAEDSLEVFPSSGDEIEDGDSNSKLGSETGDSHSSDHDLDLEVQETCFVGELLGVQMAGFENQLRDIIVGERNVNGLG